MDAVAYINHFQGGNRDEDEMELVHVATVQAIGEQIEAILKPDADIFDALDAYSLMPSGRILREAAKAA